MAVWVSNFPKNIARVNFESPLLIYSTLIVVPTPCWQYPKIPAAFLGESPARTGHTLGDKNCYFQNSEGLQIKSIYYRKWLNPLFWGLLTERLSNTKEQIHENCKRSVIPSSEINPSLFSLLGKPRYAFEVAYKPKHHERVTSRGERGR